MPDKRRYFTATRFVTGGCYRTAYVCDRDFVEDNRPRVKAVRHCTHRHRSTTTAQRCADRMLREIEAGQ
jgi:hypothetical protein